MLVEHADIGHTYFKKLVKNIQNFILNLPVWSVEVISNSRFGSNITLNDIGTLIDQHYLCNNKFPKSWIGLHHQELSVSDWLDRVDSFITNVKMLTNSNDKESLQIMLLEIKDLFVHPIFE